jgi:hypothetical protein
MVDLEALRKITLELSRNIVDEEEAKEHKLIFDDEKRKFTLEILQIIINNIDEFVVLVNKRAEVVLINDKLKQDLDSLGLSVNIGDCWYNIWGDKKDSTFPIQKAFKTRDILMGEWDSPMKFRYRYVCIPLIYDGVSAVLGIAKRI